MVVREGRSGRRVVAVPQAGRLRQIVLSQAKEAEFQTKENTCRPFSEVQYIYYVSR